MANTKEALRPWVRATLRVAAEIAAETLWPTRCAVCDAPGEVLCERCRAHLPYIDWWRACPRCGEPYGCVQCCACSPPSLERLGRTRFPFTACASAVSFSQAAGRIARVYKDSGERRLAQAMADMMARVVPPSWSCQAVTFVPSTMGAYRSRGFDHAELIARCVAERLNIPLVALLGRPRTVDQRKLTAAQRISNLAGSFEALPQGGCANPPPQRLLLVDDVFTTGATLCAATDALLAAGAREVYGLTFARV